MDFFDLQRLKLINSQFDDHEARIRRIEKQIHVYGILDKPEMEAPSTEMQVPEGWMYMTEFTTKFGFLSNTSLSHMLADNTDFFGDHMMKVGRLLFIDPVTICEYFERDLCMSAQLNRQYRSWKMLSGELAELSKQAIEIIKAGEQDESN